MKPPGAPQWESLDAERLIRGGTDPSGWQVVIPKYGALGLMDAEHVHVPFDYVALNHELALFEKKANIENKLIKCIQVSLFRICLPIV